MTTEDALPRPNGGHRPLRQWSVAIVASLVVVVLVLTALLFVWPSTNAPRRSNAIVVLAGNGPRLQKGLALAEAGYAPNLVVSAPEGALCPAAPRRVTVICFRPDPVTTQGEARAVTRLARQHHWNQLIVVSNTPQTTRARIRLSRCYQGRLLFDPVPPAGLRSWVSNLVYEWGALGKALVLQRGC